MLYSAKSVIIIALLFAISTAGLDIWSLAVNGLNLNRWIPFLIPVVLCLGAYCVWWLEWGRDRYSYMQERCK